ncbi:hypothetical protein FACS1894216_16810 [Synergistales bacterium]|nr:hypothetical protein FACS1894216_16810 [Synergistales bacterium]
MLGVCAKRRFYGDIPLSFGELNSDKTFYVVTLRDSNSKCGFFSLFHVWIFYVMLAMKKNMIPVVDLENFKTAYSEEDPIHGTRNAWEYFFEQPGGIALDEVYKSRNVVFSTTKWPEESSINSEYYNDASKIKIMYDFINTYIKFNKPTLDYINNAWNAIRPDDKKILAAYSRGTDYNKLKPANHHIQPDPSFLIEQAKKIMRENNYEYVFLVTDEKKVHDMFSREFGDKLLSVECVYYDEFYEADDSRYIIEYFHDREHARYRAALEYLTKIVIASKCGYLIGGINGGSVAALTFNGGRYDGTNLIDIGRYA